MVVTEQGGTAKAALDAIDGIIDSITKTAGIFTLHCFLEKKWLKKKPVEH